MVDSYKIIDILTNILGGKVKELIVNNSANFNN